MKLITETEARIRERKAVRKYKEKLKEKVQAVISFIILEILFVSSIVWYFTVI